MAYTLKKDNAVKIVETEAKRDRLLSMGYEDITPKKSGGRQKDAAATKEGNEE